MHIRMGTRGSALALAQCKEVRDRLQEAYPQHTFELCVISTKGDRNQHVALDQMKDKGIFVKEIEQQLLDGTIDLAVHSMKDMPSTLDARLCFTKTLLREDARDVLVLRTAPTLELLPPHARIATGSKRRSYQLLRQRNDLEIVGIRGNIETRLRKLEEQQLDGIVLAAAGLKRLKLKPYITQTLKECIMVPAVAQGALAIEVCKEREDLIQLVNALCDPALDEEVCAERAFLQELNGGCHTPLGARCILHDTTVELYAVYGNEDGTRLKQLHVSGAREQAAELAIQAAAVLREQVGDKR